MLISYALMLIAWAVAGPQDVKSAQAPVRLGVPPWVEGVSCAPIPNLMVQCGRPDEIVRCDSEVTEPVDVPAQQLCAGASLTWTRARAFQIDIGDALDVVVDWLDVAAAPVPRLMATRVLAVGASARLRVSDQQGRWLRFRRPGLSPVTVRASEVIADHWRLPDGQRGGEVMVRAPRGPVTPHTLVLEGPDRGVLPLGESGFVLRSGLAAGSYRIFFDYAGGVRRDAGSLTVTDGESTFVAPDQGAVGGLWLEVDGQSCHAVQTIEVHRKRRTPERSGVSIESLERVPTDVALVDCKARIDGLSQGPYSIVISGRDGTMAEATAAVEADEVTSVPVGSSEVLLQGTISLNGHPLSAATVTAFGGTGQRAHEAGVVNGLVSLILPRPGRYVLEIRIGDVQLRGVQKTVDVAAGVQDLQWEIRTGTVRVRVTGAAAFAEPVSLNFRRVDESAGSGPAVLTRFTEFVLGAVTTVDGMAPGAYSVYAAGPTIASPVRDFQIPEDGGNVDLTLELSRPSMTMTVMDEFGTPIRGATLRNLGEKAVETGAGQFTITGVAPGTPIPISAPGRAPACRRASATGHLEVRLSPGQLVTIELERRDLLRAPLSVLTAEDACPVLFSWMSITNLPDALSGNPRVQFANMPLGATLVIQTPAGQQRINVSSGFAIIR